MKKKLALILTLMLSIVALFSFAVIGVSAETTADWTVEVAEEVSVVKGNSASIGYTLKYLGEEVDSIINGAENGVEYTAKPYFEIYNGESKIELDENGYINTEKMEIADYTFTIKVYDKKDGIFLAEDTFTFKVTKKDNTTTIIFIVMIVLIVGYMIWNSVSTKKKQKEAQTQASSLKIGDRVKTIGGVCGFVSEINDAENTFTLEVGKDSFVKFDKGAIYQTAPAQGAAKEEEKVEATEEKKEEK